MKFQLPKKDLLSKREIAKVADMRVRIYARMKELLENYAPLIPPRTDGTQLALNNELWEAFEGADTNRMIRLVKKGADPNSLERKVRTREFNQISW